LEKKNVKFSASKFIQKSFLSVNFLRFERQVTQIAKLSKPQSLLTRGPLAKKCLEGLGIPTHTIKLKRFTECGDSSANPWNVVAPKNLFNGRDHFV
jgi:hypothetical protein